MSVQQRYRRYSVILFGVSMLLFLLGLAIGYEYVRARMCYNSYFSLKSPAWCVGDVSRYDVISWHWWGTGAITGLFILITLIAASTCRILSRKWPKSLYKAPAYLGFASLGLLLLGITSLRLLQTRWPGNTIDWRHDQTMQQLWGYILIGSAILFLVTITVGITCAIANRSNTPRT